MQLDIGHFDKERFMRYVREQPNGCWTWAIGLSGNGSPIFTLHGKTVYAHRVSYEMEHGPIPDGLIVINTCTTAGCINPAHLKTSTMRDFMHERGLGRAGLTHCHAGHPFTEENTRVNRSGRRICKACEKERMRTRRNLALIARGSVMDSADLDKVG